MAFGKLRTPSLSSSETESNEETETEETADEGDDAESSGSRFGKLKKTVGIALAAGIAVVTLRKLRSRGSDDE